MELFLKYLPFLMQAAQSIPRIMAYISAMKANYEARGEWTQEADEAFTAELNKWAPEI